MRCIPVVAFAFCMAALPAAAQQRVVVVPADAGVVIPARGASGPGVVNAPRPRIPRPGSAVPMTRPMLEAGGGAIGAMGGLGGLGLAAPALIAVPLLAAAYLAGSVPGGSSSSSTSAPARTR